MVLFTLVMQSPVLLKITSEDLVAPPMIRSNLLSTLLLTLIASLTTAEVQVADFDSIEVFTLTNSNRMVVKATNDGAIITTIKVPDREGKMADVVLGYNDVAGYMNAVDKPYFGAVVGRYGNRIAQGKFTLDGTEYTLALNNGLNSLHGGIIGFDKVVWDAEIVGDNGVKFSVPVHG